MKRNGPPPPPHYNLITFNRLRSPQVCAAGHRTMFRPCVVCVALLKKRQNHVPTVSPPQSP